MTEFQLMMGEIIATTPRRQLTPAERRDADIMRYAIEQAMDSDRRPELDLILAAYSDLTDEAQERALNRALLVAFGN